MATDILARHPVNHGGDHNRCKRSSTCRSCRYHSPPIPPPLQHPRQVYMIFLFLGEGDRFLNPENTAPPHEVVLLYHRTNTTAVILCAVLPLSTPAIYLCRSFLPLPQLSSARHFYPLSRQLCSASFFFPFYYWFSRLKVLGRHPRFKDSSESEMTPPSRIRLGNHRDTAWALIFYRLRAD